ncbi:MAG: hypothetical protein AB1726_11805 [Planctomycetota bacterium]
MATEKKWIRGLAAAHRASSFFRRMWRRALKPQASAAGSKASVEAGISISASHPRGVIRARPCQIPSQGLLNSAPLRATSASPREPAGPIWNQVALRRS